MNTVTDTIPIPEFSTKVIELARILYEEMEHLDPALEDYVEWDSLKSREQGFYCLCIEAVLNHIEALNKK